jgi:tripartite-type tricarboxylate transporter receptor subunit TctC
VKALFVLVTLSLALPVLAQTQTYPNRPIRMIVPYAAGGASDVTGRIVAQRLGERLKQQLVVENRTGAGGGIGADIAAKAAPDGYTLLLASSSEIAMLPAVSRKLPYDPVRDLAPVALIGEVPLLLVAHPSLGVQSVNELIALAKAKPGSINYGSAGIGAISHLAMVFFNSVTRTEMVHVPYKGSVPATADLVAGHLQVGTPTLSAALPFERSGQLKVLAVTSARRWPSLPNVPTLAESGLPEYEVVLWTGVMAPAGTPPDIVALLYREIAQVLTLPEIKEALARQGAEINAAGPERFGAIIKTDLARWIKVVKEADIKVD